MPSLLMRAVPLALCLAFGQPALSQSPASPAAPAAAPAEPTAAAWRRDLAFMVEEMKRRHPDLYHSVDRARFDAAVAELDARIPAMQRNEIIVGLMRIAAMVGDGHTRVDPRKDTKFGFPSLPLKLYLFEDGLFVRAATPAYASLVGAEVTAIGGVPVAEAVRRTQAISSVDNVIGYRLYAPLYLAMPDILHALKLSPERGSATLRLRKNGRTWDQIVPAGQIDPIWPPDTDISLVTPDGWVDARTTPEPPLWLAAPLDYHRLVPLPDRRALYAQINMITNIPGQSLAAFGEKIRAAAEASNPRAVIIDLRLAYGGNHDLRHRFMREMVRTEDSDTRLFVLTWRGTFSASEALLVDLDRLTDAVFVGEPASSRPNSYGDAYRTPLPNSGISIRTSIQFNQLLGQSDDPWTWVDVAAPLAFADYAAGRDSALEAALAYAPVPSLADRLLVAPTLAAVRAALDAHLADPRNRFADLEMHMLAAADRLAGAKRLDAALSVSGSAARRFAANSDAQLVDGLIAERSGDRARAAASARRALALAPNDRAARSLLERAAAPGGR